MLDIPGSTGREQGVQKEEDGTHIQEDQTHWRTPLTERSISHPIPQTTVPVTDFAPMGPTCAKAGPPILCLLLCSDLPLPLTHTEMARELVVVEDTPT